MITTILKRTLAAAAVSSAAILPVAAPAQASTSQAMAAFQCVPWQDSNTYGASCVGGTTTFFRVVAVCNSGAKRASGGVRKGNGNWAYAYCAAYGGLSYGYAEETN